MTKSILLLLVLFSFPVNSHSQNGWALYSTTPSSGEAFHFADRNTGVIVGGSRGRIGKTSDGGLSWVNYAIPDSTGNYGCVFLTNSNTIYIGGGYQFSSFIMGGILKSSDGGLNWVGSALGGLVHDIEFVDENTGYAGTGGVPIILTEGSIAKTTNGGTNWIAQKDDYYIYKKIDFVNSETGWALGLHQSDTPPEISKMVKTTNGGNNWELIKLDTTTFIQRYRDIQFLNENTGYFLWDKLYKSTDGGGTWFEPDTALSGGIGSFYFINDTGWVAGSLSGKVLRTNDGGNTWNEQDIPVQNISRGIFFIDENYGWALSSFTNILKTGTGGVTGVTSTGSFIPEKYLLYQNYPNPFNPITKIKFDIPSGGTNGFAKLTVYDLTGREVAVLVNESLNAGSYEATWDASAIPSGVYFYMLSTGEFLETRKIVLIK